MRNQMDQNDSYRWTGSKNGIPGAACISLAVVPSEFNEIIEDYALQEYPDFPYEAWKFSIRNGLSYALSFSDACWKVYIKNMVGHILHTNSAIVAYTSTRALWDKITYTPTPHELDKLEAFVYSNWDNRDLLIADLKSLRLTHIEDCV